MGKVKAFLPVLTVTASPMCCCTRACTTARTYGSGSYIDPTGEPLAYAAAVPMRLLALVGGLLASMPVDLWVLWLSLRPLLSLTGLAALLLFAFLLWRCWPRVGGGAPAHAALGDSGNSAVAAARGGRLPDEPAALHSCRASAAAWLRPPYWRTTGVPGGSLGMRGGSPRYLVGFLVLANFIVPPLAWTAQSIIIMKLDRHVEEVYLATPLLYSDDPAAHNVLLAAPDPLACAYPPIIHALLTQRKALAPWCCLSLAPHDHRLTRAADNAGVGGD